jgi:hypothetical protein
LEVVRPAAQVQPGRVAIRWFTDADLAEQARIRRERLERDTLMFTFARWLEDRADHRGPFYVPELTPETEERLLQLLRDGTAPPTRPNGEQ